MKFDTAITELSRAEWDWSARGFETRMTKLGLRRKPDGDPATPAYASPWGKEWVHAIIEDGRVERVELLVEATSPGSRPFGPRKLEALTKEYRDKLDAYVARANKALGDKPAFFDEQGAPGWPADEDDAYALAMWRRPTARIMLMIRNDGPETPFWLSIVVKPDATEATSQPTPSASTRDTSPVYPRFEAAIEMIASVRWNWKKPDDAILAKLPFPATRSGERITVVVDSTSPPEQGFTDDDVERLFKSYLKNHAACVHRAMRILGEPKFYNGMVRGFPKGEKALNLALWPLKTARLMVMVTNDDDDAPFTFAIVVTPP
jgi:hypothetical protein